MRTPVDILNASYRLRFDSTDWSVQARRVKRTQLQHFATTKTAVPRAEKTLSPDQFKRCRKYAKSPSANGIRGQIELCPPCWDTCTA